MKDNNAPTTLVTIAAELPKPTENQNKQYFKIQIPSYLLNQKNNLFSLKNLNHQLLNKVHVLAVIAVIQQCKASFSNSTEIDRSLNV